MFILFLHNTPIIVDYIYLFPALLSSCQIEVFWSVGQQLKAPRSLLYMLSWDSLAAWLAWLREHNPSLLLSLSVLLFSFCPPLPCLWLVHCISRRYEYIHESRMNQLSEWRKQHDDDVFFLKCFARMRDHVLKLMADKEAFSRLTSSSEISLPDDLIK